jgi:hypothetical protein
VGVKSAEGVEIADAVAVLRAELVRAAQEGEGTEHDLSFDLGDIEMEFQLELTVDASARGGFRAWVVSGDLDGRLSRRALHRVKLTLSPRTKGGERWHIGAEDEEPSPGWDVAPDR